LFVSHLNSFVNVLFVLPIILFTKHIQIAIPSLRLHVQLCFTFFFYDQKCIWGLDVGSGCNVSWCNIYI